MTYGLRNVVGVVQVHRGKKPLRGLFFSGEKWPNWQSKLYDYLIGCHVSHYADFSVALLFYLWLFPSIYAQAAHWNLSWVSKVVAYNLAAEVIFYGFWHWLTYASHFAIGALRPHKYNQNNQYGEDGQRAGMLWSSTGHLQREICFTTLGFLQSSAFQCVMMHLWATGRVPVYFDFWAHPAYSIGFLLFMTYWREFHFYWVHRAMHPWFHRERGLLDGDVGAFLYRHFHSLHHKSYNPGPWSGLCMHPVEHFLYYSCTLLPLLITMHPLHFLYVKYHADIAPIGGHDGYAAPGGDAAFHWLHHAKFECNYGVPLIDFDRLFGSWVDYEDYKKAGSLKAARDIASKSK